VKNYIIIGGGIIGLSTAYYLQKEGAQITVIDQSDISSGASFVNAGFVSPSHFIPLAVPGMISKGMKWMLNDSSPFYIKPRLDIDLLKWAWNFKKSATHKKVNKAIPILMDFNLLGLELYKELKSNNEFDFQLERKGLLMYYKTEKAGEEEWEIAKRAMSMGLKVEKISLDELKIIEPDVKLNIKGAIFFKGDAHMTPDEYMKKMYTFLKDKGVRFFTNEQVTDLQISGNRIAKVKTDKREVQADEIVLAAGAWASQITKKLGLKIPLQAGKGYHIDVYRNTGISIPTILAETKVAVTPMQGFTRLAGTMELGGLNHKINTKRVKSIASAAERYYDNLHIEQQEIDRSTCGLRPCSPDGLPYIGRYSKLNNLTIATGHAMMGWGLGPATGKIISEIISDRKPSLNIDIFNPERKF